MSGELRKAQEAIAKEEREEITREQRLKAEEARKQIENANAYRSIFPFVKKIWEKTLPSELLELFDEYHQAVKKQERRMRKYERAEITTLVRSLVLEDASGVEYAIQENSLTSDENKKLLDHLEVHDPSELVVKEAAYKCNLKSGGISFGFSVSKDSQIEWYTGSGDTGNQSGGNYSRTKESLQEVAHQLAYALENRRYRHYVEPYQAPDAWR